MRPAQPARRPGDPRLADLGGTAFHSAGWRLDHGLTGRRVAVVGTGASSIQFVPHVAERAARTTVFQLDAPHVIPKPDRAYPRWLRTAFRRVPGLLRLNREVTYLQYEWRAVGFVRVPALMRLIDRRARRHLRRSVADPARRAALAPHGTPGCQRILLSDDYHPAMASPTRSSGAPASPRPTSWPRWRSPAAAGGACPTSGGTAPRPTSGSRSRASPTCSCCTGRTPTSATTRSSTCWRASSGTCCRPTAGWPGPGRFNEWVQARVAETVWDRGCTSWYRTASGKNTNHWPDFTFAYRARTRRFPAEDYELLPAG